MICPVCKAPMIVVEHKKIELDYCTKCRGVWFDAGELELLLQCLGCGDKLLSDLLGGPEITCSEQPRKCPICTKRMRKTAIGQEKKILIDVCKRGEGLWFDGGELGQLLEQLPGKEGAAKELTDFMKDVFKARVNSDSGGVQ